MARKPVLIDIGEESDPAAAPHPATAPDLPELDQAEITQTGAMQQAAKLLAGRPSRVARVFWIGLSGLFGLWVSVALWDFTFGLIARQPALGYAAAGLAGLAVLGAVGLALRELSAMARLRRIDRLQAHAMTLRATPDLAGARALVGELERLYAHRKDVAWGLSRLHELAPDQLDPGTLMDLAETELLSPLDRAAEREVAGAARQVAAVTALVPLALADLLAALLANLRMTRAIAEIYGGRAGGLGTWRLMRAVMTHLVATGAVAVGDDMLGSVAGGGLLSKLSRRFGEGLVNGALTARVGVAAMEVCRPLPFRAAPRPSVRKLVQSALSGLFSGTAKDTA